MGNELTGKIRGVIERHPWDIGAYVDLVSAYESAMEEADRMVEVRRGGRLIRVPADPEGGRRLHVENREARREIARLSRKVASEGGTSGDLGRLNLAYWHSMLLDARVDFDTFMLYIEKNRKPEEKFYAPRRKVLRPIVQAFQEVADGEVDLLTVSQPKRTGKTTVGTWFVLFRAGRSPMGSSVCSGAGDMLVRSFYAGMLDVLQQQDKYAFYEVFPEAKLVSTNADDKTFCLRERRRFATVTCRPIDGQITGSTEATPDGLIYLDDTVKNEEEAVNRDRLDFLWDKVRGDVLGRRLEGCPIVAQGTRYSLYDPIGRLQEVAPVMGWRTRVVEIPALNERNESNFEIELNGMKMFSTEYYRHEKELVTEMQWESQFQQRPFEAKGRLFPEDQLNRFFELPQGTPDAIVAACDTAEKGSDSVAMPIAYIYGEDVMIADCVFSNATPEHTKPECAAKLTEHKVGLAQFESNNAGEYYARDVEDMMRKQGGKASIRLKRSVSKKATRIEVESDYIMKHFYFLDRSKYSPGSEYGMMIRELCTYTRSGKVPHDDSPDACAMLSEMIRTLGGGKVEIMRRPF